MPEPLGELKRAYATILLPQREETDLDHQPRLFAVPDPEKIIAPPSHVVIFSLHDSQFVILAQEPTRIKDTPLRPTFIKHKKGRNPRWEAKAIGRYFYDKAEAGKLGYDPTKGEVLT